MRWMLVLALVGLMPSIGCASIGTVRWLAMAMAAAAGVLAWVGHRGKAQAGGETGASTGSDVTGADGASGDAATSSGSTAGSGSGGEASSTGPTSTGDSGTTSAETDAATDDGQSTDFGPCLSIEPEPEMTVCLCACQTGPEDEGDWAPLLLLPVVARRRRETVDRLAAKGRLPNDVVRRLRRRLERSDTP